MNLKRILLAEDDPRDAKLTLAALEEYNLANKVFAVQIPSSIFSVKARRCLIAGNTELS
jgi:hypothetical protein